MNIDDPIDIIDLAIKPKSINDLQELVFRGCWENKTYQQIAEEAGYDYDYIRIIGSELWKLLSDIFAIKVTKNNFRSIFRQQKQSRENTAKSPDISTTISNMEVPEGSVGLNSPFYIERSPMEEYSY